MRKELFDDLSIKIGNRILDLIRNKADNPETFMALKALGIKMEVYFCDDMGISCEIDDQEIYRLLSGTTLMPAVYLLPISNILNVSTDYLLGVTSQKNYNDANEIYSANIELLTALESISKSISDMYIQQSELKNKQKKAVGELLEKQYNEQKDLWKTHFENMEANERFFETKIKKQYTELQNKYVNIKK